MFRGWRLPAILSAAVLLGQLLHKSAIVDVVAERAPEGLRLSHPLSHVVFAPFTMTADWLNGGSRGDLVGFVLWSILVFAALRAVRRSTAAWPRRRWLRETLGGFVFATLLGSFVVWGALFQRPIPRLVSDDPSVLIFDTHTHTEMSHDGRPGFNDAANAAWHARAGFSAAFVTDHNAREELAAGQRARAPGVRLLGGEELSLNGLHLIVLGADSAIDGRDWSGTWDSTLALIRTLRDPEVLLVASLPEFWRNRWGAQLGDLVQAGVEGFEVWTSSPKAMEFPQRERRALVARARMDGLVLLGGTDMHGLGNTATVWNVVRMPGWSSLDDAALTDSLIAAMRAGRHSVVALDRVPAASAVAAVASVPVNVAHVLRGAARRHSLSLLLWIWTPFVLLVGLRQVRRRAERRESPAVR